jgi:hypothetical protein
LLLRRSQFDENPHPYVNADGTYIVVQQKKELTIVKPGSYGYVLSFYDSWGIDPPGERRLDVLIPKSSRLRPCRAIQLLAATGA